ncbi:hypothetical protein GOODEAATRI_030581 [Goodea atripinnis]|uniref:Uncharacterized protein n=1 Tax=Goodea atripinnis TaxID=208336 RepID=A0ABV0Q2D7_9TELE
MVLLEWLFEAGQLSLLWCLLALTPVHVSPTVKLFPVTCEFIKGEKQFYYRAQKFYEDVPASEEGMMGDFVEISNVDLESSRHFLKRFVVSCSAALLSCNSPGNNALQLENPRCPSSTGSSLLLSVCVLNILLLFFVNFCLTLRAFSLFLCDFFFLCTLHINNNEEVTA